MDISWLKDVTKNNTFELEADIYLFKILKNLYRVYSFRIKQAAHHCHSSLAEGRERELSLFLP